MQKILVITGLTASGKSDLAVKIAKEFNGEIISADSVQIYKGLDIGSAKIDNETMSNVCHHLIDIKNFNENYNVNDFIEDTKKAIQTIINKGKLPIIVGGTAMYIKALIEGFTLGESSADNTLRQFYENKANVEGNLAVWNELNILNQERAKTVHYNNLKRVIRYLEIEKNNTTLRKSDSILKNYNVLSLAIINDRNIIYSKINDRVDEMIKLGLEFEVKSLINNGATRDMQALNTIGYKEWFDYFSGLISKEKTIELIKQHTRNYCKRQLTFLKTMNNINFVTIDEAEKQIRSFLND